MGALMSEPSKDLKRTIESPNFRRIAVDNFGVRISDNMAQLVMGLDTMDLDDKEVTVREATAVMTLRSLKVLQLVLNNVIKMVETDIGIIQLPPGKEEELIRQTNRAAPPTSG
jgi:hypothetical protein